MAGNLFDLTNKQLSQETLEDCNKYFEDVNKYLEHAPLRVDLLKTTKQAMLEDPNKAWIADYDFELIAPSSDDPFIQEQELNNFIETLINEAIKVSDIPLLSKFYKGQKDDFPLIGIDTETTGLDTRPYYRKNLETGELELEQKCKLVGLCLAPTEFKSYYLPVRHNKEDLVINWHPDIMQKVLSDLLSKVIGIYFNMKYDMEVFAQEGVAPLTGFPQALDVMLLWYLKDTDAPRIGLKELTYKLFNIKQIEIKELFNDKGMTDDANINFTRLPASAAVNYAAADSCFTLRAFMYIVNLKKHNPFVDQYLPIYLFHRACEALEIQGRAPVPIDYLYSYRAFLDLRRRCDLVKAQLDEFFKGVDWTSPTVLSKYLFDAENGLHLEPLPGMTRGKPLGKAKLGTYSVDEDTLMKLVSTYPEVAILQLIGTYRKLRGDMSKYHLRLTGSVCTDDLYPFAHSYGNLSQTATPTGRFASACASSMSGLYAMFDTKKNFKGSKYVSSAANIGLNIHAIPSAPWIAKKAKICKFKESVVGWNIDFDDIYKDQYAKVLKEMSTNKPRLR